MNDKEKARTIANCEVIVKALREGAKLQFRFDDSDDWENESFGDLNVGPHIEYRIKPKPRTIWVNEYGAWIEPFDSIDDARRNATEPAVRIAVEYREVMK